MEKQFLGYTNLPNWFFIKIGNKLIFERHVSVSPLMFQSFNNLCREYLKFHKTPHCIDKSDLGPVIFIHMLRYLLQSAYHEKKSAQKNAPHVMSFECFCNLTLYNPVVQL